MNKYKVVVTVPENEADKLRKAIGNAGVKRNKLQNGSDSGMI